MRDYNGELPSVSIGKKRTNVNGIEEVMLDVTGDSLPECLEALKELIKLNKKLEGGK